MRQANLPTNSYELETENTSATIDDLDSQTIYTIDVVAETSAGRGTSVATITVETGRIIYKSKC